MPFSYINDEKCNQSLKLWFSEGNYYMNNSPPGLSIFCQNSDELKKCFSLDAFKFSSHAAQTFYEFEKTTAYEKLTSWRIIQIYYAAFFSAHAILRFFGRSFSHLESGHISFLKNRCFTEVGYTPAISSSYYLISFNPDLKDVGFVRYDESHKDLWKCFLALVTELEMEVLKGRASEERLQGLSAYFSDIKDSLTDRGQFSAGNWLSVVRNEVNYKSLEGVWFPFSKSTPSFSDLLGKARDWRSGLIGVSQPNSERNNFERFFATALSVIDFGIALSLDYQSLIGRPGRRSESFSRLLMLSSSN